MITEKQLAGMIDHTNLKAFATDADMKKLCDEAVRYGFAMVAINSGQSRRCSEYLRGTNIHTGAAIGFPLGQQSIETKVFETEDAIRNGANEIDYVINITELKEKNYKYVEEEMRRIVETCHRCDITCKVIFENCYLTDEEKLKMCEIALKVGPDYIKTSTGFGTSGATLEDVRLMKKAVGDKIKVKAAGGIRTLDDALAYVEAGAERIGTSAGVKIIEEYRTRNSQ
ncbi:MAG: deoxyribose-phosphate aldolase [Erysipelotrichaceae bacterium]|nr:deoxyribose-phosphate aldolase [Erysipelotrichaceae bacterium]MBR6958692.1 deoxyribose-phosphate aldolase [Erysipelotrichaceae bacterium]